MALKANPQQVREWQQRSRTRLTTHAPLRCRKPMKKRGGKPEVGSIRDLERQLEELTRKVVHRYEKVSFTSGRQGTLGDPLELSHLFGRALRPTRWDVQPDGNCHLQLRSENSAHNNDKSIYRKVRGRLVLLRSGELKVHLTLPPLLNSIELPSRLAKLRMLISRN